MEYSVITIYPTIQGLGPHTGTPICMVRMGWNPYLGNAHLLPKRGFDYNILTMDKDTLVNNCIGMNVKWVFFTGEDPLGWDLEDVFRQLHERHSPVWVDTSGIFPLPMYISRISLGPKMGCPVNPKVYKAATDLRFYYDEQAPRESAHNFERWTRGDIPNHIIPKRLTKRCIKETLEFVRGVNRENVKFEIPLYRSYPHFDSYLSPSGPCPICLKGSQDELCVKEVWND